MWKECPNIQLILGGHCSEDASSLHEALKIADDRMYQSKVEEDGGRKKTKEQRG